MKHRVGRKDLKLYITGGPWGFLKMGQERLGMQSLQQRKQICFPSRDMAGLQPFDEIQ